MMKLGIEPATPGLQDIGYFLTPLRLDPRDSKKNTFLWSSWVHTSSTGLV